MGKKKNLWTCQNAQITNDSLNFGTSFKAASLLAYLAELRYPRELALGISFVSENDRDDSYD